MSQSLSRVWLHLVYSTKNRTPWLRDAGIRDELYAYMVSLRHKAQRPKPAKVKRQRDPATGLPSFTPRQDTPLLTFAKVKRILRDSP